MKGIEKFIMANYLDGFKGEAYTGTVEIPADKIIRLTDIPCKFVKLANWNVGKDTSFTSKGGAGAAGFVEDDMNELYYGFTGDQGGELCFQLFASKETELIPVNNLRQISVRARPGLTATLWYAWFV